MRGRRTFLIVLFVAGGGTYITNISSVITRIEAAEYTRFFDTCARLTGLVGSHDIARRSETTIGYLAVGDINVRYTIAVVVLGVTNLKRIIVDVWVSLIAILCAAAIALPTIITIKIDAAHFAFTNT